MSKLQKMLASEKLTPEQRDLVKKIKASFTDETKVSKIKKKTFAPSSLGWGEGKCPRAWFIKFNGAEVEQTTSFKQKSNMESGSDRHAFLQKYIAENPDLDVVIEQELKSVDPPIRAFADVVLQTEPKIPVEIKTASDQAFAYRTSAFKPASYNKLQLLIYCWILESEIGFLLYENRNDFENLIIPVFMKEEQEYLEYLLGWLRDVYAAYESDKIPNFFDGKRKNSKICGTCPYKGQCDEAGEVEGAVDIQLLVMPGIDVSEEPE